MNCKQVRELLSDYIDNLIEKEDAMAIESHLASCEKCRREYEDLKHLTEILSEIPEVPLPESFDLRLHEALIAANEERERKIIAISKKKSFTKRLSRMAAIFVVGIFAVSMYNNSDQLMLDVAKESEDMLSVSSITQDIGSDAGSYNESPDDIDNEVAFYASDLSEDNTITYRNTQNDVLDTAVAEDSVKNVEQEPPANDEAFDGTTSGAAASRGGTAYEKVMMLFTTDGAIFVGRDMAAVQYYSDMIDEIIGDTEFDILSCVKEDGIWKFEVETISTDEEGNEVRENILYLGQDGNLWTEEISKETTEDL